MSAPQADLVHAFRMARDGSWRQGEMAISHMPRFAPLLCSDQGVARFELEFGVDSQSRPIVTGRIQAAVTLICQRCLEPMTAELDLKVRLGIVRSEAEAVALPEDREPLQLETEMVSLTALVEDELILGLPAAPRHPLGRCRPPAGEPAQPGRPADGHFAGPERASRKKRRKSS